jgi:flagellar hook-length control protein FliK
MLITKDFNGLKEDFSFLNATAKESLMQKSASQKKGFSLFNQMVHSLTENNFERTSQSPQIEQKFQRGEEFSPLKEVSFTKEKVEENEPHDRSSFSQEQKDSSYSLDKIEQKNSYEKEKSTESSLQHKVKELTKQVHELEKQIKNKISKKNTAQDPALSLHIQDIMASLHTLIKALANLTSASKNQSILAKETGNVKLQFSELMKLLGSKTLGQEKEISKLVSNLKSNIENLMAQMKDLNGGVKNATLEFNIHNLIKDKKDSKESGHTQNEIHLSQPNPLKDDNKALTQTAQAQTEALKENINNAHQNKITHSSKAPTQGGSVNIANVNVSKGGSKEQGASFDFKGGNTASPTLHDAGISTKSHMSEAFVKEMSFSDRLQLGKDIINQLSENLKGYVGKTQSQLTFDLNPADLGKVKVLLNMKNDVISGQVIVESDAVKQLLQERFHDMKEMFSHNGIAFHELNVQTQAEFDKENGHKEKQELFNQYKEAATQVRLNRNFENSSLQYEKVFDNIYKGNGEFLITV